MGERSFANQTDVIVDVQVAPAFEKEVAQDHLCRVAESVLRSEKALGQLTVVITDNVGIQELNRDFLGLDEPTDVLSFSAQGANGPFVVAPEASAYLGDVIISYPYAFAQARELGHPVSEELDLLVTHGILHLLGYDHVTDDERSAMWARQDEILAGIGEET
jgi:probable rRNA maturation factor